MDIGWVSAIMAGPGITPLSDEAVVLLPALPEDIEGYEQAHPGAEIQDLYDNKRYFQDVFQENKCDVFALISKDCSLSELNTFLNAAFESTKERFDSGVRSLLTLKRIHLDGMVHTADMLRQADSWNTLAQAEQPGQPHELNGPEQWAGIKREDFLSALRGLLPGAGAETMSRWISFAEECVDNGQYVNFVPEPDREAAVEKWLESIYAAFYLTAKEYGQELTARVCEASAITCLYPYELEAAAAHLQGGGSPEDLPRLINEGLLDGPLPFFHSLAEVARDRQAEELSKRRIPMNFFAQELKKIAGPTHPGATYAGRACYVRLGDTNRAKLEFVTQGKADHYEALRITVLNRQDGMVDQNTMLFRELIDVKGARDECYRRDIPYAWTYNGTTEWYAYQPTSADYRTMGAAVDEYLEVFQALEQRQGGSPSMGQQMS